MRNPRLVVLCYHAVSGDWDSPLAVPPRALEWQVGRLIRRGYAPRTLSQALESGPMERTLAVTFDDAYQSVRRAALPVLARLGAPATVFVPTALAGSGGLMTDAIQLRPGWLGPESEMRCMSWHELRQLAAAGWEVGSHTVTHPDLTSVDREVAAAELLESRQACEAEMQSPCAAIAYPFGAWNEAVVEEAARAGYEYGVTLARRLLEPIVAPSPWQVPRDGVYRSTKRWEFRVATSPFLRRARAMGVFSHFRQTI